MNTEGAGPGSADLTFYEVGYAEGTSTTNLVPNARFDEGLQSWGSWGGGSLAASAERSRDRGECSVPW